MPSHFYCRHAEPVTSHHELKLSEHIGHLEEE